MGNPALEEFFGRPETIEPLADALVQGYTGLRALKFALDAEVSGLVPSSWDGKAASAFVQHWQQESAATEQLSEQMVQMSRAMRVLASGLRAALTSFQSAEAAADASACYITPSYAVFPYDWSDPGADAAALEIQSQVMASMGMAEAARVKAMAEVAAEWAQAAPLSFLKALAPSLTAAGIIAGISGALQGAEQAGNYMAARQGRFAPRNSGRFVSPKTLSSWDTALKGMSEKNWVAQPFKGASRAWWTKVGKGAGLAGVGIAGATKAVTQWNEDGSNPDLSTSARVARAATRGVAVGAGAWAGALVGVKAGLVAGAAIGSFFPGPGTAIGAAVGAVVGGFYFGEKGAQLGDWVADHTVDYAGKAADSAGQFGSGNLRYMPTSF